MSRFYGRWMLVAALLLAGLPLRADNSRFWTVTSPNHGQTYAYGSEQHQAWAALGNPPHLALYTTFTNDPYIEGSAARRYDYFTFNFPQVTLGPDERTFYYHPSGGRPIPVAIKRRDFFGIFEIRLLRNSSLVVNKSHGYLTFSLLIWDRPPVDDSD